MNVRTVMTYLTLHYRGLDRRLTRPIIDLVISEPITDPSLLLPLSSGATLSKHLPLHLEFHSNMEANQIYFLSSFELNLEVYISRLQLVWNSLSAHSTTTLWATVILDCPRNLAVAGLVTNSFGIKRTCSSQLGKECLGVKTVLQGKFFCP